MVVTERIQRIVADCASELARLTPGRSGNLSVRAGERVAITPTGVPYGDLTAVDVPVLRMGGDQLAGRLEPSSEVPMHLSLYETFEVGAVAHAHAPWATTFAVLREPIPAVHYGLARVGDHVPVADYATYGSEDLAATAIAAMEDAGTTACLLANHGVVATGADADAALESLEAVEYGARIYAQARAMGDPVTLPEDEMERVAEKFESYGQGN
ncbi:MAG: L-fuculose-phosphate aldolase [Natrialbaceae archaeon]|jgi:L-fuculose-phosphate aldolase